MRNVRRKTADPAARPYLLKAKNEGIKLSWNQYESMLPQDGFGRLGLTCLDCFQGPCRINPFSQTEERTICGLNRDELVYRSMYRFLSNGVPSRQNVVSVENQVNNKQAAAASESAFGNFTYVNGLLQLAGEQVARLKMLSTDQQTERTKSEGARQIGLGTLREDYINICLEEVSPSVLGLLEDLATEFRSQAVSRGAKGFNIVLIGDISPYYSFNTVTNQGGSELAILTGLVDLYVVGQYGLGLGRNVASSYPTVLVQASDAANRSEVENWFVQAAVAYTKRDAGRILASDQLQSADIGGELNLAELKAHLNQGTYHGVCILGGSSNVKISQDQLLVDAAAKLTEAGFLCFAYGNAAVTLGKYGLLGKVTCLGSEIDAVKVLDLVSVLGTAKVVALFPELSSARDLAIALNAADLGIYVLTAIRLPVDGSTALAGEMGQLIEYAEPKEFINQALKRLGI